MPKPKFNFQLPTAPVKSDNVQPAAGNADNVAELVQKATAATPESVPMEIKYIPKHRIRKNKKNEYPLNEIESLKESILYYGLQQPLTVIYLTAEDMYVIEAGHRRYTAITALLDDFSYYENTQDTMYQYYLKNVKSFLKGYPCIVTGNIDEQLDYDIESNNLDAIPDALIDSEIRLLITNEESRPPLEPAEKAKIISRLAALYERKNHHAASRADRINVNKEIAKRMNITERQVINYKHIDDLIPELQQEFDQNKITLKAAASISKLSMQDQQDVYTLLSSSSASEALEKVRQKNRLLEKRIKELESVPVNYNAIDNECSHTIKAISLSLQNFFKLLESADTSTKEKYSMELRKVFQSYFR